MIDPRLKVLYVAGVGLAAFLASGAPVLLSLLGLQIVLWFAARLPAGALVDSVRRLAVFLCFIVLSAAFFDWEEWDRIARFTLLGMTVPVNLTAVGRSLLLSSRIVTVILASQIVQRTGDGRELVRGLRGLGVPDFFAYGLDLVLAALGPRGAAGRGGRGGRRRSDPDQAAAPDDDSRPGVLIKRVLRGDVGSLGELIVRSITRARERAALHGLPPATVNDLAVIVGLSVLAMTLRFFKVLPGLPVAPGHKGIILIPLYILAQALTVSRWGATRFGLLLGLTSFLMGMGKFGPFEILRHVAPGLFVDLLMPLVARLFREPGRLVYALVGAGAALARLSTLVAAAAFVEAPPVFYAMLLPMLATNVVFGLLSGIVTFHLMKLGDRLRAVLADSHDGPGTIQEEALSGRSAQAPWR